MKELLYLKKYFIKYKKRLFIGTFFVICTNVFKVYSPKVLGDAIDLVTIKLTELENVGAQDVLNAASSKSIVSLILIFFGVSLLSGFFMFLMRQSIIVMSRLIENDLRNEIYEHYQVLDQAFYKRNNTGDLMNRATEDVSKVRMFWDLQLCIV